MEKRLIQLRREALQLISNTKILIMICRLLSLALFAIPAAAIALEPGSQCNGIKKMPSGMICWEDKAYDCQDRSLGRIESLMCADLERKRQDKQLNLTYQRILKSLDKPSDGTAYDDPASRKKELIEAQRAWVQFRTRDCIHEGALNGGDWVDVFVADCETRLTTERINVLNKRFK